MDRAHAADDRKQAAADRAHALGEAQRADATARLAAEDLARVVVSKGDNEERTTSWSEHPTRT